MNNPVELSTMEKMRILDHEGECEERTYIRLTAAARSYKHALPKDEFVAKALYHHEENCHLCWQEQGFDPDFCRHGAEWGECLECAMEKMNL